MALAGKVLADVHLAPVLAGELAQAVGITHLKFALVPECVNVCVCVCESVSMCACVYIC
jgi:hypothetical protein